MWYSNLSANAVVEQSYAADPLLSGWWRGTATNNQAAAAGKASVVRAVGPGGSGLVLIGTSPTVRQHAKGLQPQLGRARALGRVAGDGDDGRRRQRGRRPCPPRWH